MIVLDLPERALVDDGLVAVELGASVGFDCSDSDRAELEAFDGAPRQLVTFLDGDADKTRVEEGLDEVVLAECAADAARPEFGVVCEVLGDVFVADDVA